jgi:hypothetical protein
VSLDPLWSSGGERPVGLKTTVREIPGTRAVDVHPVSAPRTPREHGLVPPAPLRG